MFQEKAQIIFNRNIKGNYFHCGLKAPFVAGKARPGQFVMVNTTSMGTPLLRRPLGVHKVSGTRIEVLYEILGKGTALLSERKPQEFVDVIGPLGNGFSFRTTPHTQLKGCAGASFLDGAQILVAGGMGVAPLVFLAEKLAGVKSKKSKGKTLVLIGAKTKNQVLCEKEFMRYGCAVKVATDDGSKGFKGYVSGLLKSLLATHHYQLSTMYACGPKSMLKEIAVISQEYNIPAQVSLEEHMSCGFGACLGCAINTKSGYVRVCKEGPVFDTEEILW